MFNLQYGVLTIVSMLYMRSPHLTTLFLIQFLPNYLHWKWQMCARGSNPAQRCFCRASRVFWKSCLWMWPGSIPQITLSAHLSWSTSHSCLTFLSPKALGQVIPVLDPQAWAAAASCGFSLSFLVFAFHPVYFIPLSRAIAQNQIQMIPSFSVIFHGLSENVCIDSPKYEYLTSILSGKSQKWWNLSYSY